MKLKNKKTGEVVEKFPETMVINTGSQIYNYSSLAELNEEWEDYEEPKDHWHIGCEGDIFIDITEKSFQNYLLIGNDFETKEEAEKAVEKLKAWKRLEDKGFEFDSYTHRFSDSNNKWVIRILAFVDGEHTLENIEKDLDLLFGGEDE